MPFEVFISHSLKDKATAEAVCAKLEAARVRCWIAPRDINPGSDWAESIITALDSCRVMVLIFSSHSNTSPQVKREVQAAFEKGLTVMPFRIEDVQPNAGLKYYIGPVHWLDALTVPVERHIDKLVSLVKAFADAASRAEQTAQVPTTAPEPEPAPPAAQSAEVESEDIPVQPERGLDRASSTGIEKRAASKPGRGVLITGLALLVAAGAVAGWWFGLEKPRQDTARQVAPAAKPKADQQAAISNATKEDPWENSLGMKFVPVTGTQVLFSIWDTRVADFRAYAQDSGYRQQGGLGVMKVVKNNDGSYSQKWELDADASWQNPGFSQRTDHPVVGVSWDEAKGFCDWLTKKEQASGLIGPDQSYRLPTDQEWSAAVGGGKYPWGDDWPPPQGAGNYADDAFVAKLPGKGWGQVPGNDGYARTSPVGSFSENQYGLYDMGGNVWQWCEDWYRADMNETAVLEKFPGLKDDGGGRKYRVVRGGSWDNYILEYLSSSYRSDGPPDVRLDFYGFRCVLAGGSSP